MCRRVRLIAVVSQLKDKSQSGAIACNQLVVKSGFLLPNTTLFTLTPNVYVPRMRKPLATRDVYLFSVDDRVWHIMLLTGVFLERDSDTVYRVNKYAVVIANCHVWLIVYCLIIALLAATLISCYFLFYSVYPLIVMIWIGDHCFFYFLWFETIRQWNEVSNSEWVWRGAPSCRSNNNRFDFQAVSYDKWFAVTLVSFTNDSELQYHCWQIW